MHSRFPDTSLAPPPSLVAELLRCKAKMKSRESILLERPVLIGQHGKKKLTSMIFTGDLITVKDKELTSCIFAEPTHQIFGCFSDYFNERSELAALDLKECKPEIIKIKNL